ncbi:MAG: Ig-like domain-containing protein [Anaerolineaceae bacterium]|nr:Ig-like domain-containing protein [Anaerolineaceae bacterium]
MKIKISTLLLCSALFILFLASCGGPETPVTPTKTALPSQAELPEPTQAAAQLASLLKAPQELPPAVVAYRPTAGEDAALDGVVEILFDQPMQRASVESAFQMTAPDGKPVEGKFLWSGAESVRFRPAAALQPGSNYEVRVAGDAAAESSAVLGGDVTFTVHTLAPLQVVRAFPADGADQVEVTSQITVVFNRPVVPLGIAEEQAGLPQPLEFTPPVSGEGEWVSTSVYVFTPEQPLQTGTRYTAAVPGGLADATTKPEATLQQTFRWQFTTLPPSVAEIQVGNTTILPGQDFTPTNVPLIPEIVFRFGQQMDTASVNNSLYLQVMDGAMIPLRYRWDTAAKEVTVAPLKVLKMDTVYLFGIRGSAQAVDGGALGQDWILSLMTIPRPEIDFMGSGSYYRDHSSQQFILDFVSPMDIKTVESRVVFSPAVKDLRWFYDGDNYTFTFYGLEPSTEYTVTALAGMRDIYGNAINQSASEAVITEALAPSAFLEMYYAESLFRTGSDHEFYVRYTNVESLDFKLFKIPEKEFIGYEENGLQIDKIRPRTDNAVWSHHEVNNAGLNKTALKKISLAGADGKQLAPGFYLLTMDTPDVTHTGSILDARLLIVASAHLTFKESNANGLLWLTDLGSGKPIPGAALKVVDAKQKVVAEGKTGADGLLKFDLPEQGDEYDRPTLFALSTDENHFAFTGENMFSGVSPEDFGIWSSYYSLPQDAVAYLYTERPLYRPGQPVYFKGIVRLDNDLAYQLPTESMVEVVIHSYEEEVYREELPLSDFGSFDGKLMLDKNAALGSYTIEAYFPGTEQVLGTVYFTVAEYRKPEFIVDVAAAPRNVQMGGSFEAALSAEYYSGGPLAGAEVSWDLQSNPTSFNPPEEFSGYSFTDETLWEDEGVEQSYASREVAQGKAVTGEDGKLTLTLPADPQPVDPTRQLSLNVTITDFSGTSVSGQATLTAHRSQVYAGVRPESYVGSAGEEQRFELAALDWDGNPQAGQKLDVVISEREWFSVQEQDVRGVLRWVSTVKDTPVERLIGITTGEDGKAIAAFIPAKGGLYRARVTTYDKNGKPASATTSLWISGAGYIPWRQSNDRTFQLVTDRSTYEPGDQAEILIASPFQGEVYALVTVERGLIRQEEVIKLVSNSTVYRLPVSADMAPVVYVSVTAIKGVDDTSPRPDFKVGMARLDVSTEQQQLKVEVEPDRTEAAPGEQVGYTVKVSDSAGKPALAEVSLGLTDLAVLNMSDPNTGPILDYFYNRRALQVRTTMAMALSIEEYNAQLGEQIATGETAGSGGGKGGGLPGVPEVRGNFPDTAFWRADVVTDKNGQASILLTLPDNLTTWRMEARAITEETQAGQNTADLVSTRPLLVRPQTPRFFVNGDTVTLGAGVHNNTGADLTVEVKLEAQGLKLLGPAVQTINIEQGKQAYASWKSEVLPKADRVDLVFSVSGGGYQDASKPTLGTLEGQGIPVYRYEAPETVSTSGMLEEGGARAEAIRLPKDMDIIAGELDIEVAPSLAAGMRAGLAYLEHYSYECTEQTVSRFLPNVLTTKAMRAAGVEDATLDDHLRTQVNTALQRLYNQQNDDGGWGWWSGKSSHPLTSAYVVLGMIEAKDMGHAISDEVLQRGMLYLYRQTRLLPNDEQVFARYGKNTQAFLLYVLARGGDPAISETVRLYENWQSLALDARAFLTRALYEIDPQDARLKSLTSDLVDQASLSASGAHWQEEHRDPWNWGSDTRTTAIVLDTLLQLDPKNPLLPNAVRWLMKNRVEGRWGSTQETAWTLMALTGWISQTGELRGAYSYAVGLNESQLGEGQAAPQTIDEVQTLRVAVSDLLAGEANRLVFARTEGPGTLYYTANLTLALPVEQIQALDNGISISRQYVALDDEKTPITQARLGEIVRGRLTIVVPQDTHYLLVEDPLPAGLEAVDASLKTSPQGEAPERYDWSSLSSSGWGWWYFDHVELRDEKIALSATYLPAGTYVYTYLARAGAAGSFHVIPPTAQEFYFPEVYGRGAGSLFEVLP